MFGIKLYASLRICRSLCFNSDQSCDNCGSSMGGFSYFLDWLIRSHSQRLVISVRAPFNARRKLVFNYGFRGVFPPRLIFQWFSWAINPMCIKLIRESVLGVFQFRETPATNVFDFLRVSSVLWILWFHTNLRKRGHSGFVNRLSMGGLLAVDTFFVMSGFFAIHSIVKYPHRKGPMPVISTKPIAIELQILTTEQSELELPSSENNHIHSNMFCFIAVLMIRRIFRLMITLIIAMLLIIALLGWNESECDQYWYSILLFVFNTPINTNNFDGKSCMNISWYLSVDMQSYIVLIIIWSLCYSCTSDFSKMIYRITLLLATLMALSFAINIVVIAVFTDNLRHSCGNCIQYLYFPVWIRSGPYFMGALLNIIWNFHFDKCMVYGYKYPLLRIMISFICLLMMIVNGWVPDCVDMKPILFIVARWLWSLNICQIIFISMTFYKMQDNSHNNNRMLSGILHMVNCEIFCVLSHFTYGVYILQSVFLSPAPWIWKHSYWVSLLILNLSSWTSAILCYVFVSQPCFQSIKNYLQKY
eukprot:267022_1